MVNKFEEWVSAISGYFSGESEEFEMVREGEECDFWKSSKE